MQGHTQVQGCGHGSHAGAGLWPWVTRRCRAVLSHGGQAWGMVQVSLGEEVRGRFCMEPQASWEGSLWDPVTARHGGARVGAAEAVGASPGWATGGAGQMGEPTWAG